MICSFHKTVNDTTLIIRDLLAVFDTVDHHIFLDHINHVVGIHGLALQWVSSYLQDQWWETFFYKGPYWLTKCKQLDYKLGYYIEILNTLELN